MAISQRKLQRLHQQAVQRFKKNPILPAVEINPFTGRADSIHLSTPPAGCYRVTNFYVRADGKFVVEYDNTPV